MREKIKAALHEATVIANVNRPEALAPAPLEEVIGTVQKAKPNLISLIEGFLDHL